MSSSSISCSCCGSQDLQDIPHLSDENYKYYAFKMCNVCSAFVFADYNIDYSTNLQNQIDHHNADWFDQTKDDLEQSKHEFKAVAEMLENYINKNDVISEIGFGRGSLSAAFQNEGYKDIYGCEPSEFLYSLGVNAFKFKSDRFLNQDADAHLDFLVKNNIRPKAFVMWHVLEHMLQPMEYVKKLHDYLPDDGVLFGQLPTPSMMNVFPEHVFLSNRINVYRIAEQAGFKVIRYDYDMDYQFVTFIFVKKDNPIEVISIPPSPIEMQKAFDTWIRDLMLSVHSLSSESD